MQPVLYGIKTMIWREKERSRIKVVQMDNLKVLFGIRRMDRVLKAWNRVLDEVAKGVEERIDKNVLQ